MVMRYSVDKEKGTRKLDEVVKPGYILGTKQRVMLDIINKAKNYELPVVIVSMSGISFVKERQASKNQVINVHTASLDTSYARPTPISMKVEVTIMTKYMTDLYQIYGKLATQFQPAVAYSWFVPQTINGNWQELRNKIEWDGELNLDIRTESKNSDEDKFTGKMGFTIDGWLFPTMNRCDSSIIYNIGTSVVPNEDTLSRIYDEISLFRPLVYSVLKGEEWDKYNNPRQFASSQPLITAAYIGMSGIAKDGSQCYFIMDKERAKSVRVMPNSKLTLSGYNLKDVKVLAIPTNPKNISGAELYKEQYNGDIHPFPNTLEQKPANISGYLLNIVKQSDNQLTVDFKAPLSIRGEFDIAVVNTIDYDLLSERKGFKLNA
ncbi:MAG: tail sheath stabilizer and completion protein [Clostridia bacterium]|nr:tail sheath stabilizer and completion protein [Clostridia bacterium]